MDDLIYHVFWQVLCAFSFCDKVAGQVQFSDTFLRTSCTPVSFCSRQQKWKYITAFIACMAVASSSVSGTAATPAFGSLLQTFFGRTQLVHSASLQHTNINRRQQISFLLCNSDKVCNVFWWIYGVASGPLVFLLDQSKSCFKFFSTTVNKIPDGEEYTLPHSTTKSFIPCSFPS